jgi:hypothetical protein
MIRVSQRAWDITAEYQDLFQKWRGEREADSVRPLEYDYFTKLWLKLQNLTNSQQITESVENIIIKRGKKIINELKEIRLRKLFEALLRNFNIDTTYLTSQELELWNHLLIVYQWYNRLPDGPKKLNVFLESSRKSTLLERGENVEKKDERSEKGYEHEGQNEITNLEANNENYVVVRFIENVHEFVGIDLQSYGPFKPDDIAVLPKLTVYHVLLPKKLVTIIAKETS